MPAHMPVSRRPTISMAVLTAVPISTHDTAKMGAAISIVFLRPNFCKNGPVRRLPMNAPRGGIAAERKLVSISHYIYNMSMFLLYSESKMTSDVCGDSPMFVIV